MTAPVLVAGAGAAGMVAALAAASRGAPVVLLERDLTAPSTLALSGGLFAAAGTRWQRQAGIEDGPERFAADIAAFTQGTAHPGLVATVAAASGRAAEFLADIAGLDIHLHAVSRWPGHSVPRLHATPAESGAELAQLLRQAVAREPRIVIEDGAELIALEPGGVEVVQAGLARRIAARAVVLATGGFGAAPELLAAHAPRAAGAVHVGGRHASGTALRLGIAAGAATACLDSFQGQPHVSPHLVQGVRPRFGAALPALGAIMVNRAGRRFAAEDMGPSKLTAHLLAQPGGIAVEIWGEAAQQAALAGGPFRRAVAMGMVWEGRGIDALAARFGLPAATLAATLAEVAACAAGAPDPLGRIHWGTPPDGERFFAAEVTGALAHTQGGLVVDGAARVLRPDGTPIPRLFAAGGAACGVSGTGSAGYVPGNGLAQSFALGLLAGEAAARS
jgi:fumarate reductase flavoprotein subunit